MTGSKSGALNQPLSSNSSINTLSSGEQRSEQVLMKRSTHHCCFLLLILTSVLKMDLPPLRWMMGRPSGAVQPPSSMEASTGGPVVRPISLHPPQWVPLAVDVFTRLCPNIHPAFSVLVALLPGFITGIPANLPRSRHPPSWPHPMLGCRLP